MTTEKISTMFREKKELVRVAAISVKNYWPVSFRCFDLSLFVAWSWGVGILVFKLYFINP